jgi:hypothetical protein
MLLRTRTFASLAFLSALTVSTTSVTPAQDAPLQPEPAPATRRVSILDPEINMEAFSLQIPADWILDGFMVPGHPCSSTQPMAVRMESPDGLTAVRVLPSIDWSFYDDASKPTPLQQCRLFGGAESASDLLKRAIPILNVEYVAGTTTDLDDVRKKWAERNTSDAHWSVDKARAKVKFKINSIEMDGRVTALVLCVHGTATKFNTCSATISRSWAPAGQYDDPKFEAIQKTLTVNPDYLVTLQTREQRELLDLQRPEHDPVQYRHDPRRTRLIEADMIYKRQRGDLFPNVGDDHDASDPGTHPRSMIVKSPQPGRVVDDWADYVIEISPRLWNPDPDTKIPDREYVWKSAAGETLTTKSINDNPNGKGAGDWKLQPEATPQTSKP